jgi:putative membrane protein (TIGR04086 family)
MPLITGTISGLLFYIFGNILTGFFYYFTSLSENTLPWFTGGLYFTGILIGSAVAARQAESKRLYYGLAVACIFFLLSWFLGAIILPFSNLSFLPAQKFLLAVVAGAIGAVLGASLTN